VLALSIAAGAAPLTAVAAPEAPTSAAASSSLEVPAGAAEGTSTVETVAVAPSAGRAMTVAAVTGSDGAPTVPGPRATGVEPFTMLGVSWAGPEGEAQLRIHAAGAWGPWQHLHTSTEHAPDPGTGDAISGRATSDPMWVGAADGYEVALPEGVSDVRLHLVRDTSRTRAITAADADPSDPSDPSDKPAVGPPDGKGLPSAPAVHRRTSWGARPGSAAPEYADEVRMAFVHHTVNANGYAAADVPAMLRGIQAYHMDANGWSDIGYNLLIDRFGRVWEGRDGGLNRPVIGAHTGGLNTNSFGVALIGDFSSVSPASAAVDSLVQVLAWRLGAAGVDAKGTATMLSRGENDKFPAGTVVTLPTIAGHRDGKSTSCPGQRLYAMLPGIRDRVAPLAVAAGSPFGSVDKVDRTPGGVRVQGWAADAHAAGPIAVHVQVDGQTVATGNTTVVRRDVDGVFPGHGTTVGYDITVPVPPGTHQVCPIAINAGFGNNRNLGCRDVSVSGRPHGSLDVARPAEGGIFVAGWAIDPDTAAPIQVHVYVDVTPNPMLASTSRPDVGSAFPGYGADHGFSAVVPAGPGQHQVCAYAIDTAGTDNPNLRCQMVTVP